MAPKRKTTTTIGSSGTGLPVPVRTSSGQAAERIRGAAREHPHHPVSPGLVSDIVRTPGDGPHATNFRDRVGPPAGGAGPSRGASCRQTAARRPPRHQHWRPWRPLPKLYAMSSATPLVTLGVALGRVLRVLHGSRKANMHTEVLAKMADDRRAVIEVLLT